MVPQEYVAHYYDPQKRLAEVLAGPRDPLEEETRGMPASQLISLSIPAFTPAPPPAGCACFLPLSSSTAQATHEPPVPNLPPPLPRRELPFRYAVHTLFLGGVVATAW